jgi:polyvinyl alcohol dehydrogenase (cytochrome)
MTRNDRYYRLGARWSWRPILWAGLCMIAGASARSGAASSPNVAQLVAPEEIYATRCSTCHSIGIYAPTLAQIAKLRAEDIEASLWNGKMQEWANGLDSGQRVLLAQWIASLSSEKESRDPGVTACSGARPSVGGQEWTSWSADAELTRKSPSREFTEARTAHLALKWALPLPAGVPFDGASNPVAISNGRLYTGNLNHFVYSLDPDRACAYWTFRADGGIRSNVAIENGIIVFGDLLGNGYALDALTGQMLWRVRVETLARINGSITLHNGIAYVPVSGLGEGAGMRPDIPCCSFRGSVVALDARTGAVKWRHRTIDAPLARIGQTSIGTPRYGPSGVPVWSGIAVDDKRHSIYVTTGNQYTEPVVPEADAVVALDMATGARRWVTGLAPAEMGHKDIFVMPCQKWANPQGVASCSPENPKGEGDRDFGAPASLVRLRSGQELVLAASKDGMLYALSPDDGNVVWQLRVARGGEIGGVEYGIASDGERAYVPTTDVESDLKADGSFKAFDIATRKLVWRQAVVPGDCTGKPTPPCNNGFMAPPTVAGDVVFIGNTDGILRAYSRISGKLIWSFDTVRDFTGPDGQRGHGGSLGFGGPVVVANRLYIMSGQSEYAISMGGNVLLAFELPAATP